MHLLLVRHGLVVRGGGGLWLVASDAPDAYAASVDWLLADGSWLLTGGWLVVSWWLVLSLLHMLPLLTGWWLVAASAASAAFAYLLAVGR